MAKVITWDPTFGPSYTPQQMLELGVFEGKYINNIPGIPSSWKKLPKVVGPKDPPNPNLNKFKVKSRQPLSAWKKNGWIFKRDPNGWFEWYIKYFLGQRDERMDAIQIRRWRSFVARHQGQIVANCKLTDKECRPKQRQGLLQWGWDSSKAYSEELQKKNAKRISSEAGAKIQEVSTESMATMNW